MKYHIDKVLILYLIFLTSCIVPSVKNKDTVSNNESTKIIATLNYFEPLDMKIVNFEIDGLLYSLAIIDREYNDKVFDLRCKDLNNNYIIRAEFFEDSFILTDTVKNEIGIAATYNILENNMSYEMFKE
jgi:hypothetical protein